MPIEPPVSVSKLNRGADDATGKYARPVVADSSTTIAPSGWSSASTVPTASGVSAPWGICGRSTEGARPARGASSASASASIAASTSSSGAASVESAQPSGVRRLGIPGYPKNATGSPAPASTSVCNPARNATTRSGK